MTTPTIRIDSPAIRRDEVEQKAWLWYIHQSESEDYPVEASFERAEAWLAERDRRREVEP